MLCCLDVPLNDVVVHAEPGDVQCDKDVGGNGSSSDVGEGR